MGAGTLTISFQANKWESSMKGQDQKNVGNRHKNTVKYQSIHHSAHGRKELSCSALHQLHMRRIKGHKVVNPRLQMNEEEILINGNC